MKSIVLDAPRRKDMTMQRRSLDGLKAYPAHLYDGVNLDWLVLLSVSAVEESGVDLSLEHIVMAAFKLFPGKFSLLAYPSHPDAIRVDKALRRCTDKDRQWLIGKTSQGFAFTERGRQQLELIRQRLQKDYRPAKKTFSQTRRSEKLLGEVKAAPAYAKFLKGQQDKISEAECCNVLQGTLDSDRRVLRDNLAKLKAMATDLQEKETVTFMDWLGQRFARFLGRDSGHGKI
jgi:hypothetical protein